LIGGWGDTTTDKFFLKTFICFCISPSPHHPIEPELRNRLKDLEETCVKDLLFTDYADKCPITSADYLFGLNLILK